MKSPWEENLYKLKHELGSIREQASAVIEDIESLIREIESLKPAYVLKRLEYQREVIARIRGFDIVWHDEQARRLSWLIGLGSAAVGGLLSRDRVVALNAGLSGFDGLLRGLGETTWYVVIGEEVSVVPHKILDSQRNCISWEAVVNDLEFVKQMALAGDKLGSLGELINHITHGRASR